MAEYISVRELSEDLIEEYNRVLCEYKPQSCEYAYANLYAWQNSYDTKIARLPDGSFSVLFTVDGEYSFLPPVKKDADVSVFAQEVKSFCEQNGKKSFYLSGFLESEVSFAREVFEECIFYAERGNFDYIYKIEPLLNFSGKKLHAKRNYLNRFLKLYEGRYKAMPLTSSLCDECKEFTKVWNEINSQYADDGLEEEKQSAFTFLENIERFSLTGLCLYIDGKMVGYTVGEGTYPCSDTLVIHIEKGLYEYQGVYPMLFSSYLKSLDGQYKYVNREDDVDDEGLRKSKLSYHPCHFVEKYCAKVVL